MGNKSATKKIKSIFKDRPIYWVEYYEFKSGWIIWNSFFSLKECRKYVKTLVKGGYNYTEFRIVRQYSVTKGD